MRALLLCAAALLPTVAYANNSLNGGSLASPIVGGSTNVDSIARAAAAAASSAAYAAVPNTSLGAAGGVATLDGSTHVQSAQVPFGSTAGTVADGGALTAAATAASAAIPKSMIGAASGVAQLDGNKHVVGAQIPFGTAAGTVADGGALATTTMTANGALQAAGNGNALTFTPSGGSSMTGQALAAAVASGASGGIPAGQAGAANGVAQLDSTAHLPASQVPYAIATNIATEGANVMTGGSLIWPNVAVGGSYINSNSAVAFWTLAIPAPPTGGTQATAHVSSYIATGLDSSATITPGSGYVAGTGYPLYDYSTYYPIGTLTPTVSGPLTAGNFAIAYNSISNGGNVPIDRGPFTVGASSMGGSINYFDFTVTGYTIDNPGSGYTANQAISASGPALATTNGVATSGTDYAMSTMATTGPFTATVHSPQNNTTNFAVNINLNYAGSGSFGPLTAQAALNVTCTKDYWFTGTGNNNGSNAPATGECDLINLYGRSGGIGDLGGFDALMIGDQTNGNTGFAEAHSIHDDPVTGAYSADVDMQLNVAQPNNKTFGANFAQIKGEMTNGYTLVGNGVDPLDNAFTYYVGGGTTGRGTMFNVDGLGNVIANALNLYPFANGNGTSYGTALGLNWKNGTNPDLRIVTVGTNDAVFGNQQTPYVFEMKPDNSVIFYTAVATNVAKQTAAFTFGVTFDTAEVSNASATSYAATLPACTGTIAGRGYQIAKIDANTNPITLTPTGTDTISGAASAPLTAQWATVQVKCDGAGTWLKGLR